MPSYILRSIDPDFWDRVKEKASRDGWPLRALIFALLQGYVDGKIQLTNASATSPRTPKADSDDSSQAPPRKKR